MANATSATILEDGPRYTIVKFDYFIDTTDLAETLVVDPLAQFQDPNGAVLSNYSIIAAQWSIQDAAMALILKWKATASPIAQVCAGSVDMQEYPAPIFNTAGAGKNGRIVAITQGWSAGKVLWGSVTLKLLKVT